MTTRTNPKIQSDKLVNITTNGANDFSTSITVTDYASAHVEKIEKVFRRWTGLEENKLYEEDSFVVKTEEYKIGSSTLTKVTYERVTTPVICFKTVKEAKDYARTNYALLLKGRLKQHQMLEELRNEHAF